MGIAVSLVVIAIGAILTWAVHPARPGSVDVHVVGVILMVVGFVGFLLDLFLWEEWGPGYARRRRAVVVDQSDPALASPWPYRRRKVVSEERGVRPPRL